MEVPGILCMDGTAGTSTVLIRIPVPGYLVVPGSSTTTVYQVVSIVF